MRRASAAFDVVTRGLAIAGATVTLVAGVVSTVSAAACPDRLQVRQEGFWTLIRAPFQDGSEIVDYAADPADPELVYVTNGTSIMQSQDGGCRWIDVFETDAATRPLGPAFAPTAITHLDVPGAGGVVYAAVSTRDGATTVLVSRDQGASWTTGNGGLPVAPGRASHLLGAPSSPATVYLATAVTPAGGATLFRSEDFGGTWNPVTPAAALTRVWTDLSVDPVDPARLWAVGAGGLWASPDGGATFEELLAPPGDVVAHAVFHRRGSQPRVLAFTDTQTFFRSDDGGSTWRSGRTPDPVAAATFGASADEILAATVQPGSRGALTFDAGEDVWRPVGLESFPPLTDLSSVGSAPAVVYANAGGDAVVRYSGPFGVTPQDLDVFVNTPGRPGATIEGCPPPGPRAPWREGWDPAPANEPVYVTNFRTGHTVRFDSHGTGTVVAIAPKFSEGMTLDPLGRLISTTRFTNQVTRLFPGTCTLETLDYDALTAEGPTYDHEGNLYVVDTNHYYIWKYPWPQHPRQKPTLIWRMPGFLEDLKIAPPASPWAGHMFVLYRDRQRDVDDQRVCPTVGVCATGHPNAVAILEPTDDPDYEGWKRLRQDFVSFPNSVNGDVCAGYAALGIDFLPDGSLLVPDICGSGTIRQYAPDGSGFRVFARIEAPGGAAPLVLTKISISKSGQVYVTGNTSFCGPGDNQGSWLFRLDSEGNQLDPPFTQGLTCAVGVAAPTSIVLPKSPEVPKPVPGDVPDPDDPDPRPQKPPVPVRAAAVAPPPPPPPPPPVIAPAPGQAPVSEMAPAPAPNPAPAQAANPQAAAVPQQQEQPQLAWVLAANTVREQEELQLAMSRVSRQADPLASGRFLLTSAALASVAALGYVSVSLARARARIRFARR